MTLLLSTVSLNTYTAYLFNSSIDDRQMTQNPVATEWYIIVILLVCGIIIGVSLLSYIVQCSHRRWFRNRKPKRNPDQQPTEADSNDQELDLSKMNQEDNYQSLRGNVARINDVTNDDESIYRVEQNKRCRGQLSIFNLNLELIEDETYLYVPFFHISFIVVTNLIFESRQYT